MHHTSRVTTEHLPCFSLPSRLAPESEPFFSKSRALFLLLPMAASCLGPVVPVIAKQPGRVVFLVTADLDRRWTSDLHRKGDMLQQSPEPALPSPECRVNCMVLDYVEWILIHPCCNLCQVSQVMTVFHIQVSITPKLRVCKRGLPWKTQEP